MARQTGAKKKSPHKNPVICFNKITYMYMYEIYLLFLRYNHRS